MAEPERVQITMPQMGESVSEGTVLTWHKKEGDWIDKGETVVEVSTEKIDAEVPAPASGKLARILAQEDETVAVGDVLGEIEASQEAPGGDGGGPGSAEAAPAPVAASESRPAEKVGSTQGVGAMERSAPAPVDGGKITPVARRVAAAHGIDLAQVGGTGAGGRIVKDDVLAYIERDGGDGRAAPAQEAKVERPGAQPLRGGDAMLARYMAQSLEIPTATSFRTFVVAALDGRRRQLNAALREAGREMKVSFTHLIAFAIVQALKGHPTMSHSFQEIEGKPHRLVPEHFNLGLAVDVQRDDGSRTLIVPVIKGAEELDFAAFREV